MAEGQSIGVGETLQAVSWAYDLVRALKQILPTWASNFVILNRDKIKANRLKFREVGGEIRHLVKNIQPTRGTVTKGAFLTFRPGAQDEDENAESQP